MVAAEDNEKIGYHGGFALFVQLNHSAFVKTLESHFYHADSTVNNHFARIDNCGCLLTLKHNCGNLGGVCQIGDACFNNLKTRVCNLLLNFVADALCDYLARAAQTALIGKAVAGRVNIGGNVIGINADNVLFFAYLRIYLIHQWCLMHL